MIGARWRPPLRIARRTARRTPGRTALVAALVAAPVLGATFLDTAFRTAGLSAEEKATRALGAADAALEITPYEQIDVFGTDGYAAPGDAPRQRNPEEVRPERLLPAGSRLVRKDVQTPVRFQNGDRATVANGSELDTREAMTAGIHRVREGRLPAGTGELALSPSLADRLGVRVGDTVRPAGGTPATVVGLAVEPACRSCQLAIGPPGWTGEDLSSPRRYLLDLPAGTEPDWALRDRLAASGVLLTPRDAYLHPERWADDQVTGGTDTGALGVALLVVGIGLFEVILLAGTAFAVAARRQVRDVALVLSSGGRPSDVRRMLLAQGAVLGLVGGVAGVVLGVGAVLASWRGLERLVDQDFGGLIVSPRDLAVVALVGLLSGVAAAVVPAWSASHVPVVRALTGRFGKPSAIGQRLGLGGAVAAAAGLVLAAVVSWRWSVARRAYQEGFAASGAADEAVPAYQEAVVAGTYPGEPGLVYPALMLLGFGAAMVGLTVLAPSLVALAGRGAGRLWLTGRLAVRDAARHRHRTGPAVGAVMVAVAGSVAVAFAVASYDQRDRDAYRPSLPAGWASVYLSGGLPGADDEADLLATARAAAVELPGGTVVPVTSAYPAPRPPWESYLQWEPAGSGCGRIGQVGAGVPTARLITGARADEATAALAAGRAVVTDPCLVRDGAATLRITTGAGMPSPEEGKTGPQPPPDRLITVPAVVLPGVGGDGLPVGVLDAGTARRAGLIEASDQLVITTNRMPTADEEDRARAALGTLGGMQVERGYGAPYLPGFLALIGGAGLVTLAGVAISVSLSAAEGHADLATLAAIGAPPRRRRGLAMVQAALVAGLGAGLGVLLGAAIGTTIMGGLASYPLVVPWRTVLAVGLGVPVLGVVLVGAVTRSRLPMVRRLA